MTAPVLSPVRWWRSPETRYVTRGPQTVPAAAQPDPGWMFELLAPIDPATTRELARMFGACDPSSLHEALEREHTLHKMAAEIRAEAWSAGPSPLQDIRQWMASLPL